MNLRKPHILFILIYLFAGLIFSNIFQNNFVMDDFDFIVDWPLIKDFNNWPQFFVGYTPLERQAGIYSPLKTLFHAINYHFFGLNPLGYHVVSLIIHGIGIFLVYRISLSLVSHQYTALLAALFFAIHPVQVEAITYMTASVDMIGILFLLSAFLLYIKSHRAYPQSKSKFYILSLFFAFLAVFTHELALSLPLLLVWYDVCYVQDFRLSLTLRRLWPFFIVALSYALSKYLVLGAVTRGAYVYDSFYLTLLITLKALAQYVTICFFPLVLTHNHVISRGIFSFDQEDFDVLAVLSQSVFEAQTFFSLVLLGMIIYLIVKNLRKNVLISFCLGWFFIALLPGANIIPSGVYFAERYLYPGLLGFSLLLSHSLVYLYERNKSFLQFLAIVLMITCITFFSLRTWLRNQDWRDEIVLYESAVKANPYSALMQTDLGLVYLNNNEAQRALESFHNALSIRNDDPVIYFSMAEAYLKMNQSQEAIGSLKKAIELNSDYAEAYYNLAGIYAYQGMTGEAEESLKRAIGLYEKQGRGQEGRDLEKAFEGYWSSQNGGK